MRRLGPEDEVNADILWASSRAPVWEAIWNTISAGMSISTGHGAVLICYAFYRHALKNKKKR